MTTQAHDMDATKIKLKEDLRAVVEDAEDLLRATAGQAGEKADAARLRLKDSLDQARVRLVAAEQALVEKTRIAAKATDEYVHENPWKSVGIGMGVGLLIGVLIGRR
jgi:ElaB/YqjD/DUF883 family membrane-anchored ribosome-binding protein